jgi:hypothetical protein
MLYPYGKAPLHRTHRSELGGEEKKSHDCACQEPNPSRPARSLVAEECYCFYFTCPETASVLLCLCTRVCPKVSGLSR